MQNKIKAALVLLLIGTIGADSNAALQEQQINGAQKVVNAHTRITDAHSKNHTTCSTDQALKKQSMVQATYVACKQKLAAHYRAAAVFVTAVALSYAGYKLLGKEHSNNLNVNALEVKLGAQSGNNNKNKQLPVVSIADTLASSSDKAYVSIVGESDNSAVNTDLLHDVDVASGDIKTNNSDQESADSSDKKSVESKKMLLAGNNWHTIPEKYRVLFYDDKKHKEYFVFSNYYEHEKPIYIPDFRGQFKRDHQKVLNRWKTTEQYFQAQKYEVPVQSGEPHPNFKMRQLIRKETTDANGSAADKSKRYAKNQHQDGLYVKGAQWVGEKEWDRISPLVMLTAVRAKFNEDKHAQELLMSTGDKILIEDTTKDTIWGAGTKGTGWNLLGRILMRVRSEIAGTCSQEELFVPEKTSEYELYVDSE